MFHDCVSDGVRQMRPKSAGKEENSMNWPSHLEVALLGLLISLPAGASVQLDIPPRKQWDNNNGYCGECSIQQIALYFGTYISQYHARAIIDPTQRQDVWVPENSGPIFDALRLTYTAWNSSSPTPQYQAYLVWAKDHLQQGHPVIIDVFVQGESDPAYDHIMPATGFSSVNTNFYQAADTLTFNDNYETTPYTRTFGSLYDTRAMSGNGAVYEYCIPRDIDYGCAVTGIKDTSGTALPVSLKVNRWDEPNLSLGAMPVQLTATIQVRTLAVSNLYALLRYNSTSAVPTTGYLTSAYSTSTVFTATNSIQTFTDRFMSDGTVTYRCVPYPVVKPAITALDRVASGVRISFTTQTGRLYAVDWRTTLAAGAWSSLTNNVTGTGQAVTITDSAAQSHPVRFYRVRQTAP